MQNLNRSGGWVRTGKIKWVAEWMDGVWYAICSQYFLYCYCTLLRYHRYSYALLRSLLYTVLQNTAVTVNLFMIAFLIDIFRVVFFRLFEMPKNKGKGGKNRRRGKNENDVMKRELQFKEPGQGFEFYIFLLILDWNTLQTISKRLVVFQVNVLLLSIRICPETTTFVLFNNKFRICSSSQNAGKWSTDGILFWRKTTIMPY